MALTNERLNQIKRWTWHETDYVPMTDDERVAIIDRLLAAEVEVTSLKRERETMHSIEYVQGVLARTSELEAQLAELGRQEPVAWPLALEDEKKGGWTLNWDFMVNVEKTATDEFGYQPSLETIESILLAALKVYPLYARPVPQAVSQQEDVLSQIRDIFHIGSEAPLFCIVENVKNASRFADQLAAVEQEFFMVPDEDYHTDDDAQNDEPREKCLVNRWGSTTEQYVVQFRKALEHIVRPVPQAVSQPVGHVYYTQNEDRPWLDPKCNVSLKEGHALTEGAELYATAQPASQPYTVPDEIPIEITEGVRHGVVGGKPINPHRADGWNACRAAMLQSQPVSQPVQDGDHADTNVVFSYKCPGCGKRPIIKHSKDCTNYQVEAVTVSKADAFPVSGVTEEHKRVIEMLLKVCGAAFELADDTCEQEFDGEQCHVVPSAAFQKLSDTLDEIENSLPTEDADRPDVYLAWAAMPRAALKSILQSGNSPVSPDSSVPEGYALVPSTIYLDESDIESICSQCGDGGGNYGDFTRGILWVGYIQDDEGNITHGLHISSDDYPEEGGITLAKFAAAPQHKGE